MATAPVDRTPDMMSVISSISFIDLPAELRLEIYKLVLPQGATITISAQTDKRERVFTSLFEPAICAASRLIQQETRPLLYGNNTFVCRDGASTHRLLKRLRGARLKLIKKLHIVDIQELATWNRSPSMLSDRSTYDLVDLQHIADRYSRDLPRAAVWVRMSRDRRERRLGSWERLVDVEELEVFDNDRGWQVHWKDESRTERR